MLANNSGNNLASDGGDRSPLRATVPVGEARRALYLDTLRAQLDEAAAQHIDRWKLSAAEGVVPELDYTSVIGVVAEARERYGLPFLLGENTNTRVVEADVPHEIVTSVPAQAAFSILEKLSVMPPSPRHDAERAAALAALRELGVHPAHLVTTRSSATVFYDSKGSHTHHSLRAHLIEQGVYYPYFPITSGYLVERSDGHTFIALDPGTIWPERLRPTEVGSIPAVSAPTVDIAEETSQTDAIVTTSEGHLLYALDDADLRRRQAQAAKNASRLYKRRHIW